MHTEDFINIPQNKCQGSAKGMKIPSDYFEDFEAKVFKTINSDLPETKVISISTDSSKNWVNQIAIAAIAIVGLFVLTTNPTTTESTDEIAYALVEEMNYYSFDDYILAENLTMEDLESVSFTDDYISKDELLDYVLNENYTEYTIVDNL
ncbi:MAG: hypothetical protein ACPGRC_01650 [Salibacteraceae bacterium]